MSIKYIVSMATNSGEKPSHFLGQTLVKALIEGEMGGRGIGLFSQAFSQQHRDRTTTPTTRTLCSQE